MADKVALITGTTGQDGAYLAELLLGKGYIVHGLKRRSSSLNTQRVDHLYVDPHVESAKFFLHYGDMTDATNLIRLMQETQPTEIYNLAAQSHVQVSFETPEYTANADALGTLRLLEAIRILKLEKRVRFYQASTSELYGNTTNEWYAVAKIAGLKLAEAYRRQFGADFISVMPTNLYGPGDNYHPENSHVPAALIRRFHEAKMKGAGEVVVWGTGKPKREFLAADDLGDACIFVMKHYSGDGFLNVGTGQEVSIEEFARLVAEIVGYRGKLVFDTNRPDGPPRKLLDISKISALGWTAKTPLRVGLQAAYNDFLARGADVRER